MRMSDLKRTSQTYLIGIARKAIESGFNGNEVDFGDIPEDVKRDAAIFVTLTIRGKLRGCIGTMEPVEKMYSAVASCARNAAFRDCRFNPLSREEYKHLEIHVSVLSKLRQRCFENPEEMVKALDKERPGVLLQYGVSRATYLPQVWQEIDEVEEFLGSLCMKAGLSSSCWRENFKDMTVKTYTVDEFGK